MEFLLKENENSITRKHFPKPKPSTPLLIHSWHLWHSREVKGNDSSQKASWVQGQAWLNLNKCVWRSDWLKNQINNTSTLTKETAVCIYTFDYILWVGTDSPGCYPLGENTLCLISSKPYCTSWIVLGFYKSLTLIVFLCSPETYH